MSNTGVPSEESLRLQYAELNNRSRWYGSQLWQLPLAYALFSAVSASSIAGKQEAWLPVSFLVIGVTGLLLFVHMREIYASQKRAVLHMQEIEDALCLTATVQMRNYTAPLLIIMCALPLLNVLMSLILFFN